MPRLDEIQQISTSLVMAPLFKLVNPGVIKTEIVGNLMPNGVVDVGRQLV